MGHATTTHGTTAPPRARGPRVERRPQDPELNTRPRGNGLRDEHEARMSVAKLARVLGH